jgi:hypothetical protein
MDRPLGFQMFLVTLGGMYKSARWSRKLALRRKRESMDACGNPAWGRFYETDSDEIYGQKLKWTNKSLQIFCTTKLQNLVQNYLIHICMMFLEKNVRNSRVNICPKTFRPKSSFAKSVPDGQMSTRSSQSIFAANVRVKNFDPVINVSTMSWF